MRTHLEFQQTGYHSLLDSAQLDYDAIEQDVPALPTIVRQTADAASSKTGSKGASGGVLGEEGSKGVVGGASTSASGSAGDDKAEPKNKKPAHKLPKGAVAGQAFEEDVSAWFIVMYRDVEPSANCCLHLARPMAPTISETLLSSTTCSKPIVGW